MSDLRLLAFVLSGGFLFLGGIWLGGDYGLSLLLLWFGGLLGPVFLGCFFLFPSLFHLLPSPRRG